MRRRDFFWFAGFGWLWPWNWFRRHVRLAEASFRQIGPGEGPRRYIWIHGDEQTARSVLRAHMDSATGRAFLVSGSVRNVRLHGGDLDPNRMFSRLGAEQNLRKLNPAWGSAQIARALQMLDKDRNSFLAKILPPTRDGVLIALHNNGPGYSINDEIPISDEVSLKDPGHPDEFFLCTTRSDFVKLSAGSYNVVLQQSAPPDDDGSLSRLCASRGVRYVNLEAAHGNRIGQATMLRWLETVL